MEFLTRSEFDDLFSAWDLLSQKTHQLKAEENWAHDVDRTGETSVRLEKVRVKNEEYRTSSRSDSEAWSRLIAVRPDPYELLGVTQSSSAAEINQRYLVVRNQLLSEDRAACEKMNSRENSTTDAEKAVLWCAAANKVTYYEMLEEFLDEVVKELLAKAPAPRRKFLGIF